MEKKKLSKRIVLILLLINILSAKLLSQINYTIDSAQIPDFVQQLNCDFGDQIDLPLNEIEAYLAALLANSTSNNTSPPMAVLQSANRDNATFNWPAVDGAQSYRTTYLGLQDGQSLMQESADTEVSFIEINPQLALFTFASNIAGFSSILEVIIVDMDFSQNPIYGFDCSCPQMPTLIDRIVDCEDNTHVFFPWANTCYRNKYYFTIYNDNINYSESFYCLYQPDTVYVLDHCNPDNPPELGGFFFGDLNYFQVVFTHLGVHFYLESIGTEMLFISGDICGCYLDGEPSGNSGYGRNNVENVVNASTSKLLVSPNPFDQEIKISLPTIRDQEVRIVLYDLSGRVVQQLSLPATDGTLVLPTHQLVPGVYQVQVSAAGQRWQQRILKLD